MKRISSGWIVLVLAVLLLAGFVGRTLYVRSQERALAATPPKPPPALELGASDTLVATTQAFTRTLAISGGLKAVDSAVVRAKVAAEVKTLTVREGDTVKAGQTIGQLDTLEVDLRVQQADQNAASARAQLDIAQRALNNNRALVAQGFISATGLETSISNEAAARATHEAALAAVNLARKARGDTQLVAPISGLVSQRLVQPGERVAVDAKLVEIVDLSRIELEAAVAPEDVVGVSIGQVARLSIDGLAAPVTARVARINPSTQAGTRAVMVYLSLDPHPGLRQGLFSTGSIDLRSSRVLAVPLSAVRVDQAQPYVLAVVGDRVEQRKVTLGQRGELLIDGIVEPAVELTHGVVDGTILLRGSVGAVRDGSRVHLKGGDKNGGTADNTAAAASASVNTDVR
ncbi:MAG: efflux RND transporter periplasmic adaptor subunit [Pseudomonadota bacterium]|nr:efflux RND transporter periplasmic adaptor subunit [Pseudomonadota bacterium]